MSIYKQKGNLFILGAGPAGLASAYFHLKKGYKITIIEKSNTVGGLSKGISFLGDKYDLGPHSFYANYSQETKIFFNRFVGKENYSKIVSNKIIKTSSASFYSPFRASNLLKVKNLLFFGGYTFFRLKKVFSFSKNKNLIDKHGYWLRKKIFEPYCLKYFNLNANQVSDDFINLLYTNSDNQNDNSIYIPHKGYMGELWENVYEYLKEKGVVFEFNQHVIKANIKDGRVVQLQTPIKEFDNVDRVVSTIPLIAVHKLMLPKSNLVISLNYRATIIVFIEVSKLHTNALFLTNYDLNCLYGRISFCSNWSKNKENIVISTEIWCNEEDDIYNQPEHEITELIIKSLSSQKLFSTGIKPKSKVIKLPKSFPVLDIDYKTNLDLVSNELNTISNLRLIGRHGNFQWDGIDDIIYAAQHD
jgi:protoporphyrinogen oxidase